jgi:hypothetical protein
MGQSSKNPRGSLNTVHSFLGTVRLRATVTPLLGWFQPNSEARWIERLWHCLPPECGVRPGREVFGAEDFPHGGDLSAKVSMQR